MNDILSILTYKLNEDTVGDYLVSPVVAYFCFDSVDFQFEKYSDVLEEDIYSDIRKEKKALRKGKVSEITGTDYKLTNEQKRALKLLKKKYGRSLIKEINQYRKNTLAPYQVAKTYMEKSKALYPKEIYGMTKEDYLRYKKSAEEKIKNLRSNRYYELSKEISSYADKEDRLNSLDSFLSSNEISEPALNKVFKKYGLYSYRYTDTEMRSIKKKIDNVDKIRKEILSKIASNSEISKEDAEKLKKAIESVKSTRKELSEKETDTERNLKELRGISKKIKDSDGLNDKIKDSLQDIIDDMEDVDVKITSASFDKEFENFLIREKIRNDIKNRKDNKYTDDYKKSIQEVKDQLNEKKRYTLSKMAKERDSKTFNEFEKKIYELKPGRSEDSDRISDYILKIKEEDFFEPKFYSKSEEFREAERKIDAEIKRFERGLESKMEKEDYQLLKKYRLISNLITIKNAKLSDVYGDKEEVKEN